jgi:phage gpG-like protein
MKIKIEYTKESQGFIESLPAKLRGIASKGFKAALLDIESRSKTQGFKGGREHLNVRSGHLRRNIYSRTISEFVGEVGNPLVYAAIHQYGGIIRPVRAKALHFKTRSGNWVTTKLVRMPARQFLLVNEKRFVRVMNDKIEKELDKL